MKTKKAVILVAGEGTRLLPFTKTNPKCFAEINGRRILENALISLAENGCTEIRIVTGHMAERIRSAFTNDYHGLRIEYVNNPDYAVTNSMYSLFLGLQGLDGPTWVLEGDIFFERSVLEEAVSAEIAWFVDSSIRHLDGAFVETGSDKRAISLEIIRDLNILKSNQYKSVGILKLGVQGIQSLYAWLSQGLKEERRNVYYDLIIADHLRNSNVQVVDIAGKKWFEIDTLEDLKNARNLFA